MKIGDRVLVKALVEPVYVEKYRTLTRVELNPPKEMIYTGYTFRQEGKHCGGRPYGSYYGTIDYDPPYLSVDKTIKVLRVKENERCNDKFAFAEDVENLENNLLKFFGGSYQYGHRYNKNSEQ